MSLVRIAVAVTVSTMTVSGPLLTVISLLLMVISPLLTVVAVLKTIVENLGARHTVMGGGGQPHVDGMPMAGGWFRER